MINHSKKDPDCTHASKRTIYILFALVAILILLLGYITLQNQQLQHENNILKAEKLVEEGTVLYYYGNKTDLAEEKFLKALELDPDNEVAHLAIGNIHLDSMDYINAEQEYLKAIELNKSYNIAYTNLGRVYINLKDYGRAKTYLEETIRINPNYEDSRFEYGIVLYNLGNAADAEKEYKKAIELNPNTADAHYNLGILYLNNKRMSESKNEILKALALYKEQDVELGISECNRILDTYFSTKQQN